MRRILEKMENETVVIGEFIELNMLRAVRNDPRRKDEDCLARLRKLKGEQYGNVLRQMKREVEGLGKEKEKHGIADVSG